MNNTRIGIVILVAFVGISIERNFNPKLQIVLLICTIIYLITSFIIGMIKRKNNTPSYIYIGALGVSILYLLYLIGKVFLRWGENIQMGLISVTFIPITYLIIMSINTKLNSGDIKQVELVKKSLVFLAILLIATALTIFSYFLK